MPLSAAIFYCRICCTVVFTEIPFAVIVDNVAAAYKPSVNDCNYLSAMMYVCLYVWVAA